MDNRTIARELTHVARYLADHEASLYRVRAYRRAAETVLGLEEPIANIALARGRAGLQELPGIGRHIARTIETLVRTGALPTLMAVKPAKPRDERSDSWRSREASGVSACNACGASSK